MLNSKSLQIIIILIFLFNFKAIWCCNPGMGPYGQLDPNYLLRNPQIMQPYISSMSPQQLIQQLPQFYPIAMQYPQLIPVVINMLSPAQRYGLSNPAVLQEYPLLQQYIPQYPQGFPQSFPGGFPQNFGQQVPQGPQGFIPG